MNYAVVAKETATGNEVPHLHMALGTTRSVRIYTMTNKLGLSTKAQKDSLCFQYYIQPVYAESTPQANAEYVKKDHEVILEEGTKNIPDIPNALINLTF